LRESPEMRIHSAPSDEVAAVTNRYAYIALSVLLTVLGESGQAAAAETRALKPIEVGDATYVSGGVGDDEILAMQDFAPDFPLLLEFTEEGGDYISGVQVTLKDRSGKTSLDVKSDGPCFFAKLRPGHYSLLANYEGRVQKRSIEIKEHGHSAFALRWRVSKEEENPNIKPAPGEPEEIARGCWRWLSR